MTRSAGLASRLLYVNVILKLMIQKYFTWIVVALFTSVLFGCGTKPEVLVIQPNSPLHDVSRDLPDGALQRAMQDWQSAEKMGDQGDDFSRSYAHVWVRMFPLPDVPSSDPYVVTRNENNLMLENNLGMHVLSASSKQPLSSIPVKKIFFDFSKGTVQADDQVLNLEALKIQPVDKNSLTQASWDLPDWPMTPANSLEIRTRLRGVFLVKKANVNGGKGNVSNREAWSLLNILPINQYLRAVVPSEVHYTWNMNALQSQAIAARTYVLREMMEARELDHHDWDVDPTTWYQAYRGAAFYYRDQKAWIQIEQKSTDDSITATYDKIVAYAGSVIVAFFSANSGGVTCSVTECFGGSRDLPYLIAKADVEGVRKESGGTWGAKANLTVDSITGILNRLGYSPQQKVLRLEPLEKGATGRTWRLQVRMQGGGVIPLSRSETKRMMSLFGTVRSYLYDLGEMTTENKQTIVGYGFGHGVGMSQVGAKILGEHGRSAEEIMQFYYPGAYVQPLLAR